MARILSLRGPSTVVAALLLAATASALTVDFGPVTVWLGNLGNPGAEVGPGYSNQFNNPGGCTFDSASNMYFVDTGNHAVRRVGIGSNIATKWAGDFNSSGDTEGTGGNARFGSPIDVQWSPADGNVYVSDFALHRILSIGSDARVSRYVGNGISGNANGQGSNAQLAGPGFIVIRPGVSNVEMWVTEQSGNRIRRISSGTTSYFIGNEAGLFGDTNGVGSTVRLRTPAGIAMTSSGDTFYLADSGNFKIKSVTNPGAQVIQLAGGGSPGNLDGPGTSSRFTAPWGLLLDKNNRFLYIADKGSNAVKRMEISSLSVDTVYGTLAAGWTGGPTSFDSMVTAPAGMCMQYTSTYNRLFVTGAHSVAYAAHRTTRSKTFTMHFSTPSPPTNASDTTLAPDGVTPPDNRGGTPSSASGMSVVLASVALIALFVV
jgi:hypothetical protein